MAEGMAVTANLPPLEARLPCPVCLGVQMEKVRLQKAASVLVLDHCRRCGGVWFERGEVQELARRAPAELSKHIPPRAVAPRPPCHGCHAPLDRAAAACLACGTKNELSCPSCNTRMVRQQHVDLILDVCARCRGVWFDHAELKSVWSLALARVTTQREGHRASAAGIAGDVLLESLFWAPGLVVNAGSAALSGVGHAAGALGQVSVDGAANVALSAAEVVGDAAEGVFEAIMGIIASIFD